MNLFSNIDFTEIENILLEKLIKVNNSDKSKTELEYMKSYPMFFDRLSLGITN